MAKPLLMAMAINAHRAPTGTVCHADPSAIEIIELIDVPNLQHALVLYVPPLPWQQMLPTPFQTTIVQERIGVSNFGDRVSSVQS